MSSQKLFFVVIGDLHLNRSRQDLKEGKILCDLVPVVQTMDSAVRRINHYPVDKHLQNQLSYPSRIVIYPADSAIDRLNYCGLEKIV